MSLGIQFALALLFWIFLFIDGTVVPTFVRKHTRTAVTACLSEHEQVCLWTQLLFSLSLCIAGLAANAERNLIGMFDVLAVNKSVIVTFLSLLLTTVSVYRPIYRCWLFAAGFITNLGCGLVLVFPRAPKWIAGTNLLLAACDKYAQEHSLPWSSGVLSPTYKAGFVGSIIEIGCILLLVCLWALLRQWKLREAKFIRKSVGILVLLQEQFTNI